MYGTKFLGLTIEATYLDQNHWSINATFDVRDCMGSHTGAYANVGKGIINGSAKGQQFNTTSSIKEEVVGMHESMPAILWMCYFLNAQGYPFRPTKMHQDNLSGKQLETNGRAPSSKRTRHMNIRYFFVVDVQKRQHITIE